MTRSKRLVHLTLLTGIACMFLAQVCTASESEPGSKETYEVLATHETDAVFAGTSERKCRHMTSLCPDRCSHGGTVAEFTITRYHRYDKPGKYGDPKTKRFSIMLKPSEMDQTTMEKIKKLTEGTSVKLSWEHRYITRTHANGTSAKFPRRVITKLEASPLMPKAK